MLQSTRHKKAWDSTAAYLTFQTFELPSKYDKQLEAHADMYTLSYTKTIMTLIDHYEIG